MTGKKVSLIGAAFNLGQRRLGVENGSRALKNGGLLATLKGKGFQVKDFGEVGYSGQAALQATKNFELKARHVGLYNHILHKKTLEAYDPKATTVVIGGDHSISIGSISAVLSHVPRLGVIWVDAHADINTFRLSSSKNVHGMPVSYLMKMADLEINEMGWLKNTPTLKMENMAYIGLRDVEKTEEEILKKNGIKIFYSKNKGRQDLASAVDQAVDYLSLCDGIHMSFDIDSLDPVHAPATGTPVPGGFSIDEAKMITKVISKTGLMKSMDLVEVNPMLSEKKGADTTVDSAIKVLMSSLQADQEEKSTKI